VADPRRRAARTAALDLGAVRDQVAARPPRPARPAAVLSAPGRRPAWVVPVLAGAVLLAATGAGYALTAADDDPAATAAPSTGPSPASSPEAPSPEPASPAAAAPSPAASPPPPSPEPSPAAPSPEPGAPAPDGVPAGWSTETGDAGWTVALPPGYVRTRPGEFRDPETQRTLRVETGEGQPDAVADRRRAAEGFAERNPSYSEIRIEPVDYRGYEAADWEFTYQGRHVLNRVFVVDGTGHSLFFQTRAGDFEDARADFDGIAAAFAPAGA
jgi:hypothetical protein